MSWCRSTLPGDCAVYCVKHAESSKHCFPTVIVCLDRPEMPQHAAAGSSSSADWLHSSCQFWQTGNGLTTPMMLAKQLSQLSSAELTAECRYWSTSISVIMPSSSANAAGIMSAGKKRLEQASFGRSYWCVHQLCKPTVGQELVHYATLPGQNGKCSLNAQLLEAYPEQLTR